MTSLEAAPFSYYSWGQEGNPVLVFLHANSFGAAMYEPFLAPLTEQFHVLGLDIPGCGGSRWDGMMQSWDQLAVYLARFLDYLEIRTPIVAMGHSIGAVASFYLAVKAPHRFHKIVMLDPVLPAGTRLMLFRLVKLAKRPEWVPIIKRTRRRRCCFPSPKAALEHYQQREPFKSWQPTFLKLYVETCFQATPSGEIQLVCSPEREVSIYQAMPTDSWRRLRKLRTPTLIVAGRDTDVLTPKVKERLAGWGPPIQLREVPGSHLFPFEFPEAGIQPILDYL